MESEFISGFKVLLTAAQYYENGAASDHYNTSYTYDLMGNILSLKRNGLQDDGVYGAVDDLTYKYKGNQVVKIDDTVDGPYYKDAFHFVDRTKEETEYEYDGNGNMTKDLNKKIWQIEYNCLNLFPKRQYGLRLGNSSKLDCSRLAPYLPQRISYQDGSRVLYTYDAGGMKLRTDYYINPLASSVPQVAGGTGTAGTTLKHTWTDYCGNFIYENDSLKQTLVPDGYVSYRAPIDSITEMMDSVTAYTTNVPVYNFYIKDHLGDDRVVVDEKGTIEQINHYYPFGGLMGESRNLTSNQKYKYNGKELDRMHGLDWYDYGARMYDAALGQWHSMDPLAEKYMGISPYVYCMDNPVKFIDPDGKDGRIEKKRSIILQIKKTMSLYKRHLTSFNL
ncbi:MAG: RHS repeat-associated core domain-containing protein [Prevotella sp.]|jgi:RHS repeat-associated protein|nr:RHS repeat-associated core domain-containing protein [Prevotella sp.]